MCVQSQADASDARTTAHMEAQLAAARGREELLYQQVQRLEVALEHAAVQYCTLQHTCEDAQHMLQAEAQARAHTGAQLAAAGVCVCVCGCVCTCVYVCVAYLSVAITCIGCADMHLH